MKIVEVEDAPLGQELGELFREHSRLVYRTAYSVTGSAQDAEDVVQNLFLHLLRNGISAGLRENAKAYLYRAAVNMSLNAVKSRRRQAVGIDANLPELRSDSEVQTRPDHEREGLADAMANLKPRWVAMLVLRYQHD